MDCPHCGKAFHDSWFFRDIGLSQSDPSFPQAAKGRSLSWCAQMTYCPSCGKETIILEGRDGKNSRQQNFRAYPRNTLHKPPPEELSTEIKQDYEEACEVLSVSHKASAALSRRCLQSILQEQGYRQENLAQQIDALLKEQDPRKAIPTALRTTIDAIRNFGNFSAHPVTDQTTLQIISVDEGEADWCLQILDEMFDHFYVKPRQAANRKADLDQKLRAAGKPLSK